jgi:ATP-dependent DNA ligase
MLYAFDLLELDGEDLRDLPLADRLTRLLALVTPGIMLNDAAGELVFR